MIRKVLLVPLPAVGLVERLRGRVLNVGVQRKPHRSHGPGIAGSSVEQPSADASSSVGRRYKQVVEDEDAGQRDRREARIELRETDWRGAVVSQEDDGLAMLEASLQERSSASVSGVRP